MYRSKHESSQSKMQQSLRTNQKLVNELPKSKANFSFYKKPEVLEHYGFSSIGKNNNTKSYLEPFKSNNKFFEGNSKADDDKDSQMIIDEQMADVDNDGTRSISSFKREPPKMVAYKKISFMVPEKYEVQQVLGKGSYGVVCAALDTSDSSNPTPIAIKKITNIFHRDILLKRAIRELKLMRFFRGHKNIISLVDLEIISEEPYDGLYCYQELIDYDLARVIHSSVQFSEFHIKSFIYQILCGVKYLHSADVIHRDLKPGNILCTIQGTLKICDFGLARGVCPTQLNEYQNETGRLHHITSYVATRWYRAPELILSRKSYSKSIDIWACGCILAELYGRKPVFIGNDHMHQIVEILKVLGTPSKDLVKKYGSNVASELFGSPKPQYKKVPWKQLYPFASHKGLGLINEMVNWDPDLRLTVQEALDHEFLEEVRNQQDEPICPNGAFNFRFEQKYVSVHLLKEYLSKEVLDFKMEQLI